VGTPRTCRRTWSLLYRRCDPRRGSRNCWRDSRWRNCCQRCCGWTRWYPRDCSRHCATAIRHRARSPTEAATMTDGTCPVCGDDFGASGALSDHAWDAHDACRYCGEELTTEDELHVHWLARHEAELSQIDRKRAESEVGALTFGNRLAHQGPTRAMQNVNLSRRQLLGGGAALRPVQRRRRPRSRPSPVRRVAWPTIRGRNGCCGCSPPGARAVSRGLEPFRTGTISLAIWRSSA
jgi:hypothetical protein